MAHRFKVDDVITENPEITQWEVPTPILNIIDWAVRCNLQIPPYSCFLFILLIRSFIA